MPGAHVDVCDLEFRGSGHLASFVPREPEVSIADDLSMIARDAMAARWRIVAVFLIQNSSSGWFRVAAYEHTTALQAQLVVTWSSGGQQVTESLTLARGLGSDMTPAAAMALGRRRLARPAAERAKLLAGAGVSSECWLRLHG